MKKYLRLIVLTLMVALLVFSLGACDFIDKIKGNGDKDIEQKITYKSGMLNWTIIEGSTEYEVLVDGSKVATTEYCSQLLTLTSGEHFIEVNGYDAAHSLVGIKNILTINEPKYFGKTLATMSELELFYPSNNGHFLYGMDEIIFDFSNIEGGSVTFDAPLYIADSIKKLTFVSNKKIDVKDCNIIIQQRESDVIIDMKNIVMRGSRNIMNTISYDTASGVSKGELFIITRGMYNAIISGYSASDGERGFNAKDMFEHAGHGTDGSNGGNAIVAHDVSIYSLGDISLLGTNGGAGGDGGNATYGSISTHGSGGDGGNGGSGIMCDNLTYFVGDFTFSAVGGRGGRGGKQGIDGFSENRSDGFSGSLGQGIISTTTVELK